MTEMSPSERATIHELLDADRKQTTARVAMLRSDLDEITSSSALTGADDEHDPEGSSTAFERAHAQSLLDQALNHLGELDEAVERLRDGSYGICVKCGNRIPVERLLILPAARTCVLCAPRRR
ncbi:TraR/DksA C4-type zinc finger protein [Nonomuraea glycinis]|uniref:DnaK suppressor protein n=1 Tax=Nonomuraea glycinis TaxID=2047744 RepID=A0A918E8W3_9ACTN|nr:TraR/DksA C4-type zinc finger protein [Nonomuraea glycinis]MCA2180897.1 TraR/DksA C4-type zinc finger protein [Nonomuraea glycinis]GGP12970.1 DnaK suppressor protein [Nonomuraea glycinis]